MKRFNKRLQNLYQVIVIWTERCLSTLYSYWSDILCRYILVLQHLSATFDKFGLVAWIQKCLVFLLYLSSCLPLTIWMESCVNQWRCFLSGTSVCFGAFSCSLEMLHPAQLIKRICHVVIAMLMIHWYTGASLADQHPFVIKSPDFKNVLVSLLLGKITHNMSVFWFQLNQNKTGVLMFWSKPNSFPSMLVHRVSKMFSLLNMKSDSRLPVTWFVFTHTYHNTPTPQPPHHCSTCHS